MPGNKRKRTTKVRKAFDKVKERKILHYVREVVWVLTSTSNGFKFTPYYRNGVPPLSICKEVERRCISSRQPRTFYMTKACRSTDGKEYMAQPIEIHFSHCKFTDPTNEEIDPNYTVSDYLKDSVRSIKVNPKHFITDLLAFRCSDQEFSDDELFGLFKREALFTLQAKWEEE